MYRVFSGRKALGGCWGSFIKKKKKKSTPTLQHYVRQHQQCHNKLIQWLLFPLKPWQKITITVTRSPGTDCRFDFSRDTITA